MFSWFKNLFKSSSSEVFKFNPNSGLIPVQVTIKAKGRENTSTFALDTGASYVVVSTLLAESVGISLDPSNFIRTFTASDIAKVYKITLPEISALGKTAKRVPAIVKDLPPNSPVDGLLGISFFRRFGNLNFDFKKGVITLS